MIYSKSHILVVDDDTRLRELLHTYLMENGFAVTVAAHAPDARAKMALFQFDLMVLDVMMPHENGVDFALLLKKECNPLPILLLTAMGESEDKINGLEAGADDYLVKPFEPRELVLRINAILRRSALQEERKSQFSFGGYLFDVVSGRLSRDGEIISLTNSEVQLLKAMAERSPEAVSRTEMAKLMGLEENERSVDVQINRLRKKIENDSSRPLYIQTIRGAGYALYV